MGSINELVTAQEKKMLSTNNYINNTSVSTAVTMSSPILNLINASINRKILETPTPVLAAMAANDLFAIYPPPPSVHANEVCSPFPTPSLPSLKPTIPPMDLEIQSHIMFAEQCGDNISSFSGFYPSPKKLKIISQGRPCGALQSGSPKGSI